MWKYPQITNVFINKRRTTYHNRSTTSYKYYRKHIYSQSGNKIPVHREKAIIQNKYTNVNIGTCKQVLLGIK